MTPLEILRSARARIEKPGSWTQGTERRDELGNAVFLRGVKFQSCCAVGAIRFAAGEDAYARFGEASASAAMIFRYANGIESIPTWNDFPWRTHADVLAAFDRAIACAEKEATQ